MKKACFLVFVFFSANLQRQTDVTRTISLLNWLIKRDRIAYLNAKSNAAVFYDQNALTNQTLITDSGKIIPNISLSNFLSAEEVQICKTVPQKLKQTDWRIKYSKLKVKFVTDEFEKEHQSNHTIYTFSEPIYLNKACSRAVIGEYFTCGVACGRDDLLLCELKNGNWTLIARSVVNND